MERFFVDPGAIRGSFAAITGEDVAHIARVLRLKAGDEIRISDGQGVEYRARLTELGKQSVHAELFEKYAVRTEPAHAVTLYQGLPKAGKMEVIIQKCVELGVTAIVPMVTERCVVKPDLDFEKKRVRYQRVAYEAAKQSGRGIVPEVKPLATLSEFPYARHGLTLHAYEGEHARTLKEALRGNTAKDIAMLIGPEGGFTKEEVERSVACGAQAVTLGSRILRTETAGMAMLAMTLYELEG
ncbi:MAG TPA: 16S rRNA (uracil(1498)-N(3))-methyltransferase [Feifaniaceae bacterium]|nr:16S rRNA (uracil(1498)-N(3))-methyltransferase [Feifaniaceae bacterium]